MPYTPQPFTLSFIVFLFNMPNMPNLPSTPNLPNVPSPNMPYINTPSVSGPYVQAPSFQPPSVGPGGIQGPYVQGPQFSGPFYSGPNMPSGGGGSSSDYSSSPYAAPSGRMVGAPVAAQPKNHAGLWLGVLIALWSLALLSVIILILYLSGVNINPFNYQKHKLQDVQQAFTSKGLEVSRPVAITSSANFNNPALNFTFVEGEAFFIPSAGATGAGGILIFSSSGQLTQAKETLADRAKNGNLPYYVYFKDNVVVYLNVPEATAKKYEDALNSMR